jgi:hypothetical protein
MAECKVCKDYERICREYISSANSVTNIEDYKEGLKSFRENIVKISIGINNESSDKIFINSIIDNYIRIMADTKNIMPKQLWEYYMSRLIMFIYSKHYTDPSNNMFNEWVTKKELSYCGYMPFSTLQNLPHVNVIKRYFSNYNHTDFIRIVVPEGTLEYCGGLVVPNIPEDCEDFNKFKYLIQSLNNLTRG